MTGGLLVTLREGLEAFLVVGIILSYLSRADLKQYNKWIYIGAGLGLVTSFILAFLFQTFFTGFDSELGELHLKIGIMGFAVVVLSYMVVWMSKNSTNIKGNMEQKLDRAISAGSVFALIFMAYLAILREGFETVLFLGAVYGDDMGTGVLYGGLLGLVIAFIMVYIIFKGMRKLPIKTFFKVTGALILLVSAGLLSNMIGVMQDIGLAPVVHASVFDISWIMSDSSEVGIFFKALFGYTSSPSIMQISAYTGYIFLLSALLNMREKIKVTEQLASASA